MRSLHICLLIILLTHMQLFSSVNFNLISFEAAMKPNAFFEVPKSFSLAHWNLMKHLYDTFVKNGFYRKRPRIPKIIHHIWLGSPLPEVCKSFRKTWKAKHPDWQFLLWTDKDVESFGLQNKTLYDATKNYGSKSDIARYEILYRHGGLYVDTDFECLHPFDELHHKLNFYTGIGLESEVALYNGLVACAPGHPILKNCIETLPKKPVENPTSEQIMQSTGPHHFTRSFFSVIRNLPHDHAIAALPPGFVYPWPHYQRGDAHPKKWIRPESIALHYWHVSWMK